MNKEHKEIIQHGFNCFNYLIDENLNHTFDSFANIIEHYTTSLQAKEISRILRKYKGTISKQELIIDLS